MRGRDGCTSKASVSPVRHDGSIIIERFSQVLEGGKYQGMHALRRDPIGTMLPKTKKIVFFASDFGDDEFKSLPNQLTPLIDMDKLWSAPWLEKFKGADIIVVFKNLAHLNYASAAARRLMNVASEVSVVCVPTQYASLADELENANVIPDALKCIDDEDFATMVNPREDQIVHPAQDYTRGVLRYGVTLNRQPNLISSDGDFISFTEARKQNILLKNEELPENRFSQLGIIRVSMGMKGITPPALHREVADYLRDFVYIRDGSLYDVLTTWVIGTYVFTVFRFFPYLHINAERGSGKTLLLEILAPICFNGELLTNPGASPLLSIIQWKLPTLLIDETEALTTEHAARKTDLMAILRTGFASSGKVVRANREFPTYCPKAFAGINTIDDTLADRTIVVKMTRKTEADNVQHYLVTEQLLKRQAELRDELYSFGLEHGPGIAASYNVSDPARTDLSHLRNRSYDIWRPLITIADLCGVTAAVTNASRTDLAARQEREGEQDDTALLIQGLIEVSRQLAAIKVEGKVGWYNPDLVHSLLVKEDCLPRRMSKTALSRYLRQKLDIKSVPVRVGLSLTRLYVIDWDKIDEYGRRYFANSTSAKSV